ncbi:protein O-mannosyl-transferase TMTC1 isoform X5 [Hippoglossus hippoglossus]|uniref:protein O-mannosyl-transferase TMTC1 isoform X5 n=1 Tax=Hippoglossus hippoglossus TaxID=8267 RepID=UPI00148CC1EF|nr:protein O-mannosyl-transferase TMTC1 isoform X5 [Hippoglossus hippoglossus]
MLQPQSSRAAGEAMRDLTAPEPQKKGRRQPRVIVQPEAMSAAGRYVVLTALCVLCYCNSLRGELVHDDVWAIINNPDVRPGSSLINIFSNDFWGKMMADNTSHKSYRPLCILSFKLNILLGGMTPLYFHMVNVCFHCAVTCLLMHTCKSCVFEDSRLAFITALLFAVHPVHTEAVSGVVGRADVLACLLFLLTFLSYVRSVGVCVSEDSLPSTMSACSLIVSLLLGTCAMLIKETGITVFGVCVLYDALVLCCKPLINHLYSSRPGNLLYICSPFVKRACLISGYVVLIMSVRLWLMGGSMPLFSEQDNPASFSPHLLTRILTYSYLLSFNAGLLLAPIVLCYDWQVGSIPLVESLSDFRNVAAMLLAIVMVALCLHCVFSLQRQESREVLVGVLFLVFPFIPASNLFFRVGFVVAERVLYMPRLYPRHASAMNNLGTLTHCSEEAEHFYRKALDTNPQHNRALFNLGNLLKSQGKAKEAEVLLMDSINFGAHFADAYSSLASLYAEQKRFPEANEVYLKGIENCPDNSDLHNNYGVFLVDTGEGALAEAHYLQAVRLKPAHYVAMVNLGRLLRSSNENEAAESWYKRALQITRKVDILTPLGALYYNTGRFEEALQVYREAAALQPDNTDIWLALAQVLAMVSHTIEAEKMTLDIISREGSCIECYRLLSAIYSKRGNFTEALDALDRALQQNPSDLTVRAELYFSKGNQLREMNQLDRAFESYKLAVELKPDRSQAWMNMGGIQHIKGDYAAARMYYQRALLLNPGSKLLKENLAKLDRLERKLTVEA